MSYSSPALYLKLLCGIALTSIALVPLSGFAYDLDEFAKKCASREKASQFVRVNFRTSRDMQSEQRDASGKGSAERKLLERSDTLLASGSMWRYETSGNVWNEDPSITGIETRIKAWDGTEYRSFLSINNNRMSGTISATSPGFLDITLIGPLMLAVRPSAFGLTAVSEQQKLEGNLATHESQLNNRPCLVISRESGNKQAGVSIVSELWADLERDYSLVRVRTLINGDLSSQVDIDVNRNTSCGWFPAKWEHVRIARNGKGVADRSESVVSHAEFGAQIPKQEIQIAFPSHTYVVDAKSSREYFIQQSGAERTVTRSELLQGTTYTTLIDEDKGGSYYFRVIVSIAAIAVVLGAAIVVWRRKSAR